MKNYIFMINIQNELRSQKYDYSIKSWKKWCEKNNYELFILEERIYGKDVMNPNWHKMFVFDLFDSNDIEYDQICFVDADTIVHPNCPDFFKMSDHKFCGVFNDGSYDWLLRSIEVYKKYLFPNVDLPFWKYINSGFMIANRKHKDFFKSMQQFYFDNKDLIVSIQENFHVGTDQPVINFYLTFKNISCKLLPYEFNMQDMFRKEILSDMLYTKIGWIYHFNAIPQEVKKQTGDVSMWLERTYRELWK
tara:strand:+ start:3330 stop:4073 length:744 start_codon:yes stop_codon:yes gene_type:complete